jgi:glutamate dehydrogenase
VSTSAATPIVQPFTTPLSANRIAHYFEQVQSNAGHYWSPDDAISTLRGSMTGAFRQIVETSERERVTLRDAAYMIGVGRVAEASRLRGWV